MGKIAVLTFYCAFLTCGLVTGFEKDICDQFNSVKKGPKALDNPATIELKHGSGAPSTLVFKSNFDLEPAEIFIWAETTRPGIEGRLDIGSGIHSRCMSETGEEQGSTDVVYVRKDAVDENKSSSKSGENTSHSIEGRWLASRIEEDGSVIISALWKQDGLWHWTQSIPVGVKSVNYWSNKARLQSHRAGVMGNYESPPMKGRRTLAVGDMTYESFYDGCEVKQGCVGCTAKGSCTGKSGQGCLGSKDCQLVVSYNYLNGRVNFQLLGRQVLLQGWVAMGISRDSHMGADSVVMCKTAQGRQGLNISIDAYWNSGKTAPNLLDPSPTGVVIDGRGRYENGDLFCAFSQNVRTTVESNVFDLFRESYYVLLASGPGRTDGSIAIHTVRGVPGSAVNLTSVEGADPSAEALALSHGVLMILAWVGAASSGILTARYYKRTWVSTKACDKAVWFMIHRVFMIMTWFLTIIAFALIVIKEKGIEKSYHSLIGLLVLILTFVQPIIAMVRCGPNSPHRLWFNWAHWLIGSIAHILAFVNIFLALDFTGESEKGFYVFGAFVLIYCLINVILQCQNYMGETNERNSTSPLVEEKSDYDLLSAKEAPGTRLRRFFYGVIILVNWGAAIIIACVIGNVFGYEIDDDWTDGTH